jgi:hypothetical protein
MLFSPFPGTRKAVDLLTAIAPVFRIDLHSGEARLIGSGFWVTDAGHLVTARHVIDENIGTDGADLGPIIAIQTFANRSIAVRNFRKSDKHSQFDLALSERETAPPLMHRPTTPIAMTLDKLRVGDPVFSFAVLAHDQVFAGEALEGHTAYQFFGELVTPGTQSVKLVKFAVRLSMGTVNEIFEKMRDTIMLPFSCIQTNAPIYGGNSGGPLFDIRGRICAVNCTSFGGNDISFHIPIEGVLDLCTRAESLGLNDLERTYISLIELAVDQRVAFDPPILNYDQLARSILRWLWYAVKCLARRELPSATMQFASAKLQKTPRSSS